MPKTPKLTCTKCGGEMTHHADKLVVTAGTREPGYDSAFGGYIEEGHTCPRCGHLDTRRAEA